MIRTDVQVLTYAPTVFRHCQHCEVTFGQVGLGGAVKREQSSSSLPSDLADDFALLAEQASLLYDRYGDRVRIRVIDAASIEGIVKSLRHRVWRYPAIIVDGRRAPHGSELSDIAALIEKGPEAQGLAAEGSIRGKR